MSVQTGLIGGRARIEITNTGPVIDPAGLHQLFEPFHRANGRARSTEHGLGLGLSIVRAVADAHGADVTAVPRPDGGLTVTVTIPGLR